MEDLKSRENQVNYIASFIKDGEKPNCQGSIGIELEHFIIDKESKKRRFYYYDLGVENLLERLAERLDVEPIYADQYILGLKGDDFDISIEPGAQFEISIHKDASILSLYQRYRRVVEEVLQELNTMGASLVTIGLDPVNKASEIPIIPRERYRIMNNHMIQKGSLTQYMMRASTALQIAFDYFSEEDFHKKFTVATALSPVFYTLFDNVSYKDGKKIDHYNMRQEIWRNTDNDRCGLIPGVFQADFGYKDYASWLLDVPILFIPQKDLRVKEVGNMTLSQALAQAADAEEAEKILEHGISIVFPDVRVKHYIEVRQMDEVPEDLAFGAAALIKGLFYSSDNVDKLYEYFKDGSLEMVERGKNSGRDNGIQGYYFSKYFASWGLELVRLAENSLSEEEAKLLKPLELMWDNLDTPRLIFERIEREEGFKKAIEAFEVSAKAKINQ